MVMTILHPGVIRCVAIYAQKYEGYAYWWNGGTLREMLNLDNAYGNDIYALVMHPNSSEEDYVKADRLRRFRKKRTQLAWTFVIIMCEVDMNGNLHSDLFLDNILLHFSKDESRIYIGVSDWGLTSKAIEPMKSLYTFTSEEKMTKTLRERWWLDPRIAYLHKRNAGVGIIPRLTKTSEAYAVGKIAIRINKGNMSEDYWKLQMPEVTSSHFPLEELGNVFEGYLNRLWNSSRQGAGGLSHIVTLFRAT